LLGATAGEAVVWYGGQFYALFFLTQTLKVPAVTAQILIAVGLLIGTPFFILFGWLSDKVGRKPIILAGFLLAALTYFPIFKAITHYANPALEAALASSPVTVIADPNRRDMRHRCVQKGFHVLAVIAAIVWFALNGLLWYAKPSDLLWLLGGAILGVIFL
jgi:MFS family permease